ncbi:hypothetical protein CAL7102_03768 [Dulcicalothrix desertica PCC 7102]|nr:hypothetical protein CAL7102_03768 [Dulcicalothrix desertica PCC 7102]
MKSAKASTPKASKSAAQSKSGSATRDKLLSAAIQILYSVIVQFTSMLALTSSEFAYVFPCTNISQISCNLYFLSISYRQNIY